MDHHFSFLKFIYLCLMGCILYTFSIIVLPYLINSCLQHVLNFLTSPFTKNFFITIVSFFPNVKCNCLTIIDCLCLKMGTIYISSGHMPSNMFARNFFKQIMTICWNVNIVTVLFYSCQIKFHVFTN